MPQAEELLRFAPLQSVVDVTFLAELSEFKLNVWKLSEEPVEIVGYFSSNRYDSVPARLQLDVSSLRPSATSRLDCHAAPGQLRLYNTVEGFHGSDKQQLMRQLATAIWLDICCGAAETEPWRLARFLLLMHGDLKHYKFRYWFAFPALKPPSPFTHDAPPGALAELLPASAVELISAACAAWLTRAPPPSTGVDSAATSTSTSAIPDLAETLPEVLSRSASPFWLLSSPELDFSRDVSAHPLRDWADLTGPPGRNGAADPTATEEEAASRGDGDGEASGCSSSAAGAGGGSGACVGCARRHVVLVFSDSSHQAAHPAWQLRNALLMAAVRWRVGALRVLCLRESSRGGGRLDPQRSQLLRVRLPSVDLDSWPPPPPPPAAATSAAASTAPAVQAGSDADLVAVERCPDAVGWEANAQGRLLPRFLDLGPHLRPEAQAEQAVELNLRLMRWRAVPELEVGALAATKCLLLGAGTLGCAVARTLQAWGVRHITLVDSGRVAFSNPVRQSLYSFEDCLGGGRPKAEAAAEALRRIFPSAVTRGLQLCIPMPGHPPAGPEEEQAQEQATQQLDALVSEHDAVFLLTDTRESRWLPALMAAARRRIAITAAVGFDSFLVMRHGAPPGASNDPQQQQQASQPSQPHAAPSGHRRLGCYFCNDVFAPANSTRDRSLDQQCTVARPGLAPVAGALAVELLAAMVQHGCGLEAALCAPPPSVHAAQQQPGDGANHPAPLGPAPHMVRGQLASFSQVLMEGWAFGQCTACSPAVVEAYLARGWALVREALGSPAALEELTGLAALHASAAAVLGEDYDDKADEKEGRQGMEEAQGAGKGDAGEDGGDEEDWTEL